MNALHAVLPPPLPLAPVFRSRVCGTGEMADLIRQTDWGATALGDLALWPESLLTTVNLLLSSPIPTSVYWGPQHVLLYNDGYRQFLAHRHPDSLGKYGAEVWKEAWHIVGPQIEHTFRTAEAFHGLGFLVPIEQDGRMVDRYWDYSFSPVYDARSGRVIGIYNTCSDVTAAVQTTRERDGLAQRLNELLEVTSESVILIDRNWRFTYLNRAAEEFARPLGNLVGKCKWKAFPSLSRETPHGRHCIRAMEHGESSEFESYYPAPIDRWRRVQVRPTADGIVLFARDITDEKRAGAALKASNEALAASEEELRWTILLSSQKPWTADVDGTILKHSGNMTAATGLSNEKLLADRWTNTVHPADVHRMEQSWRASVRTGQPYDIEFRMLTSTGAPHWLRARAYPRRDPDGRIVKWYGITDDIDGQKRAGEALKSLHDALAASEEELRWTISLSEQMVWSADPQGMILKHTENLAELTGHSDQEVLGTSWTDLIHADDVERMRLRWSACVRTGEPYDVEFRMHTTTGEHHWFRARAYPRRNADGNIIKWYGITDDIDDRRRRAATLERTAAALAASEEELSWMVRLSAQLPWTAAPGGAILSISERWYEKTGATKEQALGDGWTAVQHPDDVDDVIEQWTRAVRTGKPFDMEHRIRMRHGEFCWMRSRAFPRLDEQGAIIRWYGTTEDIQAQKTAEEAVRTSEKLAAVGRLATSIAHEINNPLEAVTNLLYLARTSEGLPEVQAYIKNAEEELHRASVITNQTLRFQRQSTSPIALDSEDLIENCLAVFQGKLQNGSVEPEKRLRAKRAITCYDGEIRQVFLNLVGNAIDAMQPGGGRLLIRTREAAQPATGRLGVVLTVADTGSGIPPEALKKLFEPFFTTKGINGTGLGLWVTKDIVARHHGALRVRSKAVRRKSDLDARGKANGGTVFTLFLPFDAALRHAPAAAQSEPRDAAAA